MSAKLLQFTDIYWVAYAARLCSGTVDKMDSMLVPFGDSDGLGPKDKALIENRLLHRKDPFDPLNPPHESVLEHAVYTFEIEFSRACLQELARHRIASISVESTRWALKRILNNVDPLTLQKYITQTGDAEVDQVVADQVMKVAQWCNAPKSRRKSNDIIKFAIPEGFRTHLIQTINARSLRNLFSLRTSSRALWEIRETAFEMVDALPEGHKFLFEDRIHKR